MLSKMENTTNLYSAMKHESLLFYLKQEVIIEGD